MTVEIVDQKWYLKFVEDEGVFVKTGDTRFKSKTGQLTEKIVKFIPSTKKKQMNLVTICFEAITAPSGKVHATFNIADFDKERCSTLSGLDPCMTAAEFVAAVESQVDSSTAFGESTSTTPPTTPSPKAGKTAKNTFKSSQASTSTTPHTTPSPKAGKTTKRKGKSCHEEQSETVDLPSPGKKFRPSDIDERIDSAYIGHFHLKVDSLIDYCPTEWLDRPIDESYVKELEDGLSQNPTIFKNQQPWIGITDVKKRDILEKSANAKSFIKGCRITVIGGRHRHAAYKKASKISTVHAHELDKVWIDLYGSDLNDEDVRRLACTHNTANKGSMPTNYATRVHACRQWLYKMAEKDMATDETPASTQKWKAACQKMYAPVDKNPNTLEPTIQAALLRKDVYNQFEKVCGMHASGSLKDQKMKKKGKTELTQNQLGMPLQGLSEDTKLSLLTEVTTNKLSLKEMKKKCERIKKKRMVIAAFLRHTGVQSWEMLKERFPLHTTEEKLSQFGDSSITKLKTPQEVVNFFEKALEWEKKTGPINLQEERDGIFIYNKENHSEYGILMEGSIVNAEIGTEKIKRIVGAVPFKGFSLVIGSLPYDLPTRELQLFLNCVHAANVDSLNNYTIALFVSTAQVAAIKDVLQSRFGVVEVAYWVDLKHKKAHRKGDEMSNSVHPIIFGYWTKGGAHEIHSYFEENSNRSNAFCFEIEEENCLPKTLLSHIIRYFSLECQWVLDMTSSKDAGLVSALSLKRNCVSLMKSPESLRETAKVSALSIAQNNSATGSDREDADYSDNGEDNEECI